MGTILHVTLETQLVRVGPCSEEHPGMIPSINLFISYLGGENVSTHKHRYQLVEFRFLLQLITL